MLPANLPHKIISRFMLFLETARVFGLEQAIYLESELYPVQAVAKLAGLSTPD